jgi:mannose-6-phosphate isomerase-like protein (cupin superfamily)
VSDFGTTRVAATHSEVAPDGSEVRPLLRLAAGSMAHFALAPGRTSKAVAHRTVEELWLVLSGRGELWRWREGREEVVALEPGVCVSIPRGTRFQFRSLGRGALHIVGATMPPWPGAHEAVPVEGRWRPTVA